MCCHGSAAVLDNLPLRRQCCQSRPRLRGSSVAASSTTRRTGSGCADGLSPARAVEVRNCTFTDNWNGVDDKGRGSAYSNTIFWNERARWRHRPPAAATKSIYSTAAASAAALSAAKSTTYVGTLDPEAQRTYSKHSTHNSTSTTDPKPQPTPAWATDRRRNRLSFHLC